MRASLSGRSSTPCLSARLTNHSNTGRVDCLRADWGKFKLGLNYSLSMIGTSRVANVITVGD
jgi:hypothetical protein